MKKRVFALLICSTLILSACGKAAPPTVLSTSASNPSSVGEGKAVNVWAWDANFNIPIIQKAGDIFALTNSGFTVNVSEMSNNDVNKKLVASFTSNAKQGLPDIVLLEDYDAQSFLQNYPGKFEPLERHIDFSQFAQYKVDAVSLNGSVYAVPFDSGVAGIYYRTDYIEQAGYTPQDMQNLTWSKFIEIGKAVKEKTGKWFTAFKPYSGTHYVQMAMQSAGLWYFNDKGEIYLKDNAAVREICEVLKEIEKSGISKPVEYYEAEGIGAITSGDAACVMSAIWYSPTIKSTADQAGKWGYTNIPRLETVSNATQYSNLGGSSWYILSDSPNKEIAIEMMKEVFAGNNDFYQEILVERGAVGTFLPSQSGTAYEGKDEFFNNAPIFKDFSSWMAKIPGVDYGVNTYVAADAISAVTQSYFDGKTTLDEMLTQAEDYYKMQVV